MLSLLRRSISTVIIAGAAMIAAPAGARDYANWMAELPDEAYVCTLSIPGTHDSATGNGFTSSIYVSSAQTQDLTVEEQMNMGVRAFDFRPGRKRDGLFLGPYRLKCFHGMAEIDYWFDDAIKDICKWLTNHPNEFFIIHLYKPDDSHNKDCSDLYNELIADTEVAPHIAKFDPSLKVKDMRGKILFLKRYEVDWNNTDISGNLWEWDETKWKSREHHIKNGWENKGCRIVMQDHAGNVKAAEKAERVKDLYLYSSTYSPASENDMVWFMNFASSYSGSTSSNTGYLENAAGVNPVLLELLETTVGPTGIVLMDWVGDDYHLNKHYTQGETLVHAIADNNFRYIHSMVNPEKTAPAFTDMNLEGILPYQGTFRGNMEWVDLNSDGNLDVVFKGRDVNDGWWPKYMAAYNDGNGNLTSSASLPRPGSNEYNDNNSRVVVPIDYNADGHVDLIYGCANGSVLLSNDGHGNLTLNNSFSLNNLEMNLDAESDGTIETRGAAGLMHAADFNLDGYADIITYSRGTNGSDGTPILFLNQTGTGSFANCSSNLPELKNGTMAIGDYDSDGAPDVLVSGLNSSGECQVSICLNRGMNGTSLNFDILTPEELQPYATTLGMVGMMDLNNDGKLDIFISGRRYDNVIAEGDSETKRNERMAYSTNVFIRQSDGSFHKPYACSLPMSGNGMDWCDVNGDGFIDIVYSGTTNICKGWNDYWKCADVDIAVSSILINQGDGTFAADHTSLAPLRGGVSVSAADINGDGKAEIAMMGYGGPCVHIYTPVSTGKSQKAPMVKEPAASGATITSAGDGKTTLTWNNSGNGNRYNYVVKTKDGKVFSAVPVDPETGTLRVANLSAAPTGNSVTLNIDSKEVEKYAVQSVSQSKNASDIEMKDNPGPTTDIIDIDVDDNAPVEYYNLQGQRVKDPQGGCFIERRGSKVTKRYIP